MKFAIYLQEFSLILFLASDSFHSGIFLNKLYVADS